MFAELTLADLVIRSSSHTPFFGVYLATHAVADGLCMCHASVGCKVKTELHLCDHDGVQDAHNRRRYSQFIDEDLIQGSTAQLEEEIRAWSQRQKPGIVVIDGSTPISLQGQSMAAVCKRMEAETGADVVFVDARNYDDDLYAGYAQTMATILQRQPWQDRQPRANEVAIVGQVFDRYEPDQFGNVAELRRMLAAIGLQAPAVFFSGEKYAQLQQVVHAGLHVVLPHAHAQAKVLKKLGLSPVVTGLPMALSGTKAWLRQVARHVDALPQAEVFIDSELRLAKPFFELARRRLAGKRFAVFSDAPRAAGVVALLAEVGMEPALIGTLHLNLGGEQRVRADLSGHFGAELPKTVRFIHNPTPEEIGALDVKDCAVVLGTTIEREGLPDPQRPFVEFSFPSESRHFLTPAPFLGFAGALRLVEQVLQTVASGR
ncbi:MAG: hypothetical protein EXR77_08360 [Myxococcales bacterium]|nr:hypothetical protein [Myxococcales bacterium]